MISFETGTLASEWALLKVKNPLLVQIVLEGAEYAEDEHGWNPFRVTCIYRTPEEDSAAKGRHGVHCLWRAVDVGAHEVSAFMRDDVADHINKRFTYDPARPDMVVAYAEPHGTGLHVHFQTHPNTVRSAA